MNTPLTFHVHYFGLLADRRGLGEESIQSTARTAAELYAEINARYPMDMQTADFRAVVNDAFVPWDEPVHNEDRVAFLPPMSGG